MTRTEQERIPSNVFTERQRVIIERIASAKKFSDLPNLQQLTIALTNNPDPTVEDRFQTLEDISGINGVLKARESNKRIKGLKRNNNDWPPRYMIIKTEDNASS